MVKLQAGKILAYSCAHDSCEKEVKGVQNQVQRGVGKSLVDMFAFDAPLGPLGSSSFQHRRTPEIVV